MSPPPEARVVSPGATTHQPALDHLRALAITSVFLFHARLFPHPAWIAKVGDFGWIGVDLFFALSGYLIASQLFAELKAGRLDLRAYFVKRALRILPAYWVVVGLYAAWPAFRERGGTPPFARLLTFTQNFGLTLRVHGTFSHAWSLCIEEQFYLALPLVLWLAMRSRRPGRALWLLPLLFVSGFVTRALAWHLRVAPVLEDPNVVIEWYRSIYYPTYQRLDGLLAGVGLAALVAFAPRARAFLGAHRTWLLAGCGACLGTAYWLFQGDLNASATVVGFPLIALGQALLVAAAVTSALPRLRVTEVLAQLSFAVYLVHKGVIHLVQGAVAQPASTATFLLCVVATLAAAALLRVVVERPALALRAWLLRQGRYAGTSNACARPSASLHTMSPRPTDGAA